MYSELQIPEEELLREVLPEVERSDITPEELQGLEEAGLDFIRFPQIRSRLADIKRAILRTALMRGNLRHAIRKAAQVGAHKVYHKITQGDSV
ncbi:MAG: hypothetical protein L3J76_06000, partial [Candidatus Hydrothermae bacterium]|nr:hypothetical protein [Candidatus Hydrothermae bacterium]